MARIAGMFGDRRAADDELARRARDASRDADRRERAPRNVPRPRRAVPPRRVGRNDRRRRVGPRTARIAVARNLGRRRRVRASHAATLPGVHLVAVATLALGIGANTAIFSVVSGVLLQPLPYPNADRLMSSIDAQRRSRRPCPRPTSPIGGATLDPSRAWRRRTRARPFSPAVATPSQLSQARVSANAFDVLGIRPILGRAFATGEDAVSAPRVACLSERLWRTRFGGDSTHRRTCR